MSGDVQPRKRKDKRRKKGQLEARQREEYREERALFEDEVPNLVMQHEDAQDEPAGHFTSDEHFHIHKDVGTGGNICAKIIFFVLLTVLLGMVGLILFEHRGMNDLDTPLSESRFADYLVGWVDESPTKHDDHAEVAESGEHDEHDEHDEHEEEEDEPEESEEPVSAEAVSRQEQSEEEHEPEGDSQPEEDEEEEEEEEEAEDEGGEEESEEEVTEIPGVTESVEDADEEEDGNDDEEDQSQTVSGEGEEEEDDADQGVEESTEAVSKEADEGLKKSTTPVPRMPTRPRKEEIEDVPVPRTVTKNTDEKGKPLPISESEKEIMTVPMSATTPSPLPDRLSDRAGVSSKPLPEATPAHSPPQSAGVTKSSSQAGKLPADAVPALSPLDNAEVAKSSSQGGQPAAKAVTPSPPADKSGDRAGVTKSISQGGQPPAKAVTPSPPADKSGDRAGVTKSISQGGQRPAEAVTPSPPADKSGDRAGVTKSISQGGQPPAKAVTPSPPADKSGDRAGVTKSISQGGQPPAETVTPSPPADKSGDRAGVTKSSSEGKTHPAEAARTPSQHMAKSREESKTVVTKTPDMNFKGTAELSGNSVKPKTESKETSPKASSDTEKISKDDPRPSLGTKDTTGTHKIQPEEIANSYQNKDESLGKTSNVVMEKSGKQVRKSSQPDSQPKTQNAHTAPPALHAGKSEVGRKPVSIEMPSKHTRDAQQTEPPRVSERASLPKPAVEKSKLPVASSGQVPVDSKPIPAGGVSDVNSQPVPSRKDVPVNREEKSAPPAKMTREPQLQGNGQAAHLGRDDDDEDDAEDDNAEDDDAEAGDDEIQSKEVEEELSKEDDEQQSEEDEPEEGADDDDDVGPESEEDQEPEPTGVALKFGVGVALVIVAHVVLVRKWNSGGNVTHPLTPEAKFAPTDQLLSPPPSSPPPPSAPQRVESEISEEFVVRRQTLLPDEFVPLPADEEEKEIIEDSEYSDEGQEAERKYTEEEEGEEDESVGEEEEEEEIKRENEEEEEEEGEEEEDEDDDDEPIIDENIERIMKKYSNLERSDTESEEEEEEEPEKSDKEMTRPWKLKLAEPASASEEEEEDTEEESVEEEEEDEDEDLVKLPVPPPKVAAKPKLAEEIKPVLGMDEEEDDEDEPQPVKKPAPTPSKSAKTSGEQSYVSADITNSDDWIIRNELDLAEAELEEKPESALKVFTAILSKYPRSPRGHYGKARALDLLAEMQHSNRLLEQAIETYKLLLLLGSSVPDLLFLLAADRCINRMRFKGQHLMAVQIHKMLMRRFPDNPSHRNQLAVTYLMVNRLPDARRILRETLDRWPDSGFAQVHYGFILKTGDQNMTAAVEYLSKGIATREPGTIDGRFFFQLGDALMRLGRRDEAMKVNELGVKEGLFLSKYQRSLYNVNRLRGQPWWSPEETTYASYFKKLVDNWAVIQSEGLNALYHSRSDLYKDEAENLKDSGQWKQLELFARGRKIAANCANAPRTCQLIENFPAARDCRRGQVKFSVMHAGTHVWPHCGPTNCRLRAHLGLVVPQGTSIRVADETRSWEEGKLFIFDDSFEHEVWHNGTTTRLVLIVDVWHPELTEEEKRTLPAI